MKFKSDGHHRYFGPNMHRTYRLLSFLASVVYATTFVGAPAPGQEPSSGVQRRGEQLRQEMQQRSQELRTRLDAQEFPDPRDEINRFRQEAEQRMQESRQRMNADLDAARFAAQGGGQESTMDKLRPYRRTIRWGIGLLIVGAIILWKKRRDAKSG